MLQTTNKPDADARALLSKAVESLIALLDLIEIDPDLEPNGDEEPSLGWPVPDARWGHSTLDATGGDDREHDAADEEPSMGWTELEARYGKYSELACSDLEEQCEDEGAEHDGREPDYDNEAEGQSIPGGAGL